MFVRTVTAASLALVGAVTAIGACNGGASAADGDAACDEFNPPTPPDGPPPAFNNFCNWSSADAMNPEDAADGIHGLGALKVYWNQSPPAGSKSFPIGTIIVKESEQQDPTNRVAFAMVKRGCGFNVDGANGWEWWSLSDNGDCTMKMLWRGVQAPVTESYGGTPVGNCNGCHEQVVDNDYVWDTALQLSNF